MGVTNLLELLPHGTNPTNIKGVSQTYRGQAHFAGTGPEGVTCRECNHWAGGGHYYAKSNRHGPTLKPAICRHWTLRGQRGEEIPHNAAACKYFEKRENPPTIMDKR